MDGKYDKEEAVKRLLPQKLTDQYAFLTEKAIRSFLFTSWSGMLILRRKRQVRFLSFGIGLALQI